MLLCDCIPLQAQQYDPQYYAIGTPALTDIWVDPVLGNDTNSGNSRGSAVQTVQQAWGRIPMGVTLSVTGYRIQLVAGTYPVSNLPNYWESRHGTYQFPIIIRGADGPGTSTFLGDMNLFDCRYMYLLDFNIIPSPAADPFHCEQCDHFLLRGMVLNGGAQIAQEGIKANQSQYMYIENSDISGAWDNAIDFVGVQYGHIQGNKIHNSGDWCEYAKGGSAYLRVEGNEYYDCGTGGFTAGQGTGFEFMTPNWLHYEAYDIKFINNIIHDTNGAGIGVNGGYNILMAYNTMYRVGSIDHVIESVFGQRGCDGNTAQCNTFLSLGGWGTSVVGPQEPIPNRHAYIYNNIVYNPAPFQSQWQHFAIYGPQTPDPGTNIPDPAVDDDDLRIRGNIIWNGPSGHPLGIEDMDMGCQPANPTCNATQLVADNAINTIEPQLIDPANGNFRPVAGGNVFGAATYAIPNFPGNDRPSPPGPTPAGNYVNPAPRDRDGITRSTTGPPGAFQAAAAASSSGSIPDGSLVPGASLHVAKAGGSNITLTFSASCAGSDTDFEIYEGTIGNFSSHTQFQCSTSGLTSATILPNTGSKYYLVVPRNGSREGSYGKNSSNVERPQGVLACNLQQIAVCP